MGGVRRHNAQLLPRVAKLLADAGGELVLLQGREPVAFELSPDIRVIKSDVPASPAPVRASAEGRALRRALKAEAASDKAIDLVHVGHMPTPRSLPVPHTHTILIDGCEIRGKVFGNLFTCVTDHRNCFIV